MSNSEPGTATACTHSDSNKNDPKCFQHLVEDGDMAKMILGSCGVNKNLFSLGKCIKVENQSPTGYSCTCDETSCNDGKMFPIDPGPPVPAFSCYKCIDLNDCSKNLDPKMAVECTHDDACNNDPKCIPKCFEMFKGEGDQRVSTKRGCGAIDNKPPDFCHLNSATKDYSCSCLSTLCNNETFWPVNPEPPIPDISCFVCENTIDCPDPSNPDSGKVVKCTKDDACEGDPKCIPKCF
jgi:hypothetical protein